MTTNNTTTTPSTIELVIHSEGRGFYTACIGDRVICTGRREPYLASARILQAEGVPDDAVLQLRHAGSSTLALSGRIGTLAKRAVRETDGDGPRLVTYRDPQDRLSSCRVLATDGDFEPAAALTTL